MAVPRVDEKHDLPPHPKFHNFKSVKWVPTPEIGNVVFLTIFFASDPSSHPKDLGHRHVAGQLPLTDGQTVWVVEAERPLSDPERKLILSTRDEFVGDKRLRMGTNHPGETSAAIMTVTTSTDGAPLVVQTMLGSHNVM